MKLVRWHQRSQSPPGSDLEPLIINSHSLSSLDLSEFYCWTEDLPPALESHPSVSYNFTRLNLLNLSFSEGFKSHELRSISASCPNLKEFLAACMFNPSYIGFVGDEALIDFSKNCPKLSLLHLADTASLSNGPDDPEDEDFSFEDSRISRAALIEVFTNLSLLEELALEFCKNVRDSGLALEVLNSKCPKLKSLKLGQFHGICLAVGSQLDGIAICSRLESLSIKNSADLNDMGLIGIARGCSKLAKFEVVGCKKITWKGLRTLCSILHRTLIDVKISCCKNFNSSSSLQAVSPISDRIQRLHIDCVWNDSTKQIEDREVYGFDLNKLAENSTDYEKSKQKKLKYSVDMDSDSGCSYMNSNGNAFWSRTWEQLKYLSLWIAVGELLTPLAKAGLEDCPNLEEISIKVEGDCRERPKPLQHAFGLSSLARYPLLSKMQLDCGDTIGYALTAPSGLTDLSSWERFYLCGITSLNLNELDYWLPQDRDVNQRGLSLPGAAWLQQCVTLRKLVIHGTAHEHFLMFFPHVPNLRDVQLREDYYPAPENDTTEMRIDSYSRFEDALNGRPIPD